jgi:putative glycosyltransferase
MQTPALSIVATMYRSADYINEFCHRISKVAGEYGGEWELVLVNDGSPDDSLAKAIELQKTISQIIAVDLSRNFGHHQAILAGLREARGERVFLIDCDLEESPEWLGEFKSKMEEVGADVVYGQQKTRKGNWFEGISGKVFYQIFNFLSIAKVPESWVTARLMTRQYVNSVLDYGERALFLGGTFTLAGYLQVPVKIIKGSRGSSTYSINRRIILFVDAIASFSPQPLYLIFVLGLFVTILSTLGFVFVIIRAIFGDTLIGWASLIASIWLFGGLTIFSIGLVGVYVGKVLIESKRRPLFHIKKIYRSESLPSNS